MAKWSYGVTFTPMDMVREFHLAMGQPVDQPLEAGDLLDMREQLIVEEYNEVVYADSKENLIKELADLLYVIYGYAVTFGIDLDEAFKRVHESNMSKLDDNGKPIYREDGKVMKGPNYKKPDMRDLVK